MDVLCCRQLTRAGRSAAEVPPSLSRCVSASSCLSPIPFFVSRLLNEQRATMALMDEVSKATKLKMKQCLEDIHQEYLQKKVGSLFPRGARTRLHFSLCLLFSQDDKVEEVRALIQKKKADMDQLLLRSVFLPLSLLLSRHTSFFALCVFSPLFYFICLLALFPVECGSYCLCLHYVLSRSLLLSSPLSHKHTNSFSLLLPPLFLFLFLFA